MSKSVASFDDLVDNLNRNVILHHIHDVENGKISPDRKYFEFIKNRENYVNLHVYQSWRATLTFKRWIYFLISIVVLSLASLGIYWFYLRPSEIRKECASNAVKFIGPYNWKKAEGNNLYRLCLTNHGLQPESLLVNLD